MKLIDKAKIVEEIERIKKEECPTDTYEGRCKMLWFEQFYSFLDTIETEDVNTWHKQSEKDIYDSFNDWSYHTFLCLMDDGSVQKFSGICDECVDGTVNKHIDAIDDEYDDVDKIVYWIETPITLK